MLSVTEHNVLQCTLPSIKLQATAIAAQSRPPLQSVLRDWELAVHSKCDAILRNDLARKGAWYSDQLSRFLHDELKANESKAVMMVVQFRAVENLVDDVVSVLSKREELTADWIRSVYGVAADFMAVENALYAAFPYLEVEDDPEANEQAKRDAELVVARIETRRKHQI